jgi:hypothetical protein
VLFSNDDDVYLVLADQEGLVGFVAVEAVLVFLAVHRHRLQAELRARPRESDRNFAAVAGHNLLERLGRGRQR